MAIENTVICTKLNNFTLLNKEMHIRSAQQLDQFIYIQIKPFPTKKQSTYNTEHIQQVTACIPAHSCTVT